MKSEQSCICLFPPGKMGQHDKKMERQLSVAASQAVPYRRGQCVCQMFCSQAHFSMFVASHNLPV